MMELITATITTNKYPALIVFVKSINLAKNPEKIGIPAIDSSEAVSMPANNELVLPRPLKFTTSSLSLSFVTYRITENAAIPAKE